GEGYDQELLSKMEVPLSEAFVNKYMHSDILEVKNIIDYNTPETELHRISRVMHKNNKNMVTLIATLKYGDNVVGHIYIDSFHVNSFDEGSKKMLEMFSNLASTFLTLKFLRDSERESTELNTNYLSF